MQDMPDMPGNALSSPYFGEEHDMLRFRKTAEHSVTCLLEVALSSEKGLASPIREHASLISVAALFVACWTAYYNTAREKFDVGLLIAPNSFKLLLDDANAFFGLTAYFALTDPSASSAGARGGLTFLAAVFCGLLGNLDRISSIKASLSGIEATTREAKAAADEARASVQQLHALAAMTASMLIDLVAGGGRFGTAATYGQRDQQKANVIEALQSLGMSAERIKAIALADKYCVESDYMEGIFTGWQRDLTAEEMQGAEPLIRNINAGLDKPTPDECRQFLTQFKIHDPDKWELIEDYEHYLETGLQRRPDVWSRRGEWLSRRLPRETGS